MQDADYTPGWSTIKAFRNPANAHVEAIDIWTIVMGALFGPLYYIFQGAWGAVLSTLLFGWIPPLIGALLFAKISPAMSFAAIIVGLLIWSMLMTELVARAYLRKGWVRVF